MISYDQTQERKKVDPNKYAASHAGVLILAFGVAFSSHLSAPPGTPLRWLVYGLPAVSLALWLSSGNAGSLRYDPRHLTALVLFIAVAGLSFAVNPSVHFESVRDFLIIGGVFVTFLPHFSVADRNVKALAIVFAVCMFIPVVVGVHEFGSFDALASSGIFETNVAFPMSVFALYFLVRRQWFWFFVTLLLSFIAFKRIALVGFVFAVAVYYVLRLGDGKWRDGRAGWFATSMVLCAVLVLALSALNFTALIDFVISVSNFYMGPDEFTLGRYSVNERVQQILSNADISHWLLGSGAGSADRLVHTINPTWNNMHNDFLKLLVDYGVIGMAVIVFGYFWIYRGYKVTLAVFVFNAFIMVTDNTVIYYFHQFACFMIARALMQEYSERAHSPFPRAARQSSWL